MKLSSNRNKQRVGSQTSEEVVDHKKNNIIDYEMEGNFA